MHLQTEKFAERPILIREAVSRAKGASDGNRKNLHSVRVADR